MSAAPAFPYRMLWATSTELIDYAAALDMNWVVVADAMNIWNVRATENGERTAKSLQLFLNSMIRYAPMYDDWRDRIAPTPENIRAIAADNARNVERAEGMVERIKQLAPEMPEQARTEFTACFDYLLTAARSFEANHQILMTLWGMRQGTVTPDTGTLDELVKTIHTYGDYVPLNHWS